MQILSAILAFAIAHVSASDAPLREWETNVVPRRVRARTGDAPTTGAEDESVKPLMAVVPASRVRSYKNYVRAPPTLPPTTPAPTHLPGDIDDGFGSHSSGLYHLGEISRMARDLNQFILVPSSVDRLRGLIRGLVAHGLVNDDDQVDTILRSSDYRRLEAVADVAQENLINSIEGIWLAIGVLFIQAYHIVDTLILGLPKTIFGWEHDYARFGYTRLLARPPPLARTYDDAIAELAGRELLDTRVNSTKWKYVSDAMEEVFGLVGVEPRPLSRLLFAILRIHGKTPWQKLELAQETSTRPAVPEEDTRNDDRGLDEVLEDGDTSGLVHHLIHTPIGSIENAIDYYFSPHGDGASWMYIHSDWGPAIRPRRFADMPSWAARERLEVRLRACGRLIGFGLRHNVVPGLRLSPATMALLRTPGLADYEELAKLEDPATVAAIDNTLRYLNWTDEAAVQRVLGGRVVERDDMDEFIRAEKIARIVLSIDPEMWVVRQGMYEVTEVKGLLDILTIRELDAAIRGVDALTVDMIVEGLKFESVGDPASIQVNEWFVEIVRTMTPTELGRLVKLVTGCRLPPMNHEHSPWMWIIVQPLEGPKVSLERDSFAVPMVTSRDALRTTLFEAMRAV